MVLAALDSKVRVLVDRYKVKVVRFVVLALVLVLAIFGITLLRSKTPIYQTGIAKVANVTKTSDFEGVLSPEMSSVVSPGTAGVVTSVLVSVGQAVSSGQALATISPSNQDAQAVLSAQASLAQAQASLAQAETAESSASTTTTTSPSSQSSQLSQLVAQAQATLKELCSNTTTSSPQCGTLKSDLSQIGSQSTKTQSKTQTSLQNQASLGSLQAVASADQQIVVADQSALTAAQSQDQPETLSSPIAGTVGAVAMSLGENVAPGPNGATITVIGNSGGTQVTLQIPSTEIDTVALGQEAKVVPVDGVTSYLAKVSSIGSTPTTDKATGTSTLPVVLTLTDFHQKIFDGMDVEVQLYLARAAKVLAVPTSSITVSGTKATVQVLKANGSLATIAVSVGVVGSTETAIVSKELHPGDKVVLANLNQPIPTSNSLNTRALRKSFAG